MPTRFAIDDRTQRLVEVDELGRAVGAPASFPAGQSDSLPIVAEGFVDIQINGLAGINFGNPNLSTEQLVQSAGVLARQGVTHFLPTLITDAVDRMEAALGALAKGAREEELGGAIAGIHIEGPYLSPVDGPRGAHPLEHCKNPDRAEFDRLQRAAEGRIKIVTLAPELPGAEEFIRYLTSQNVRVAIGHTAATRAQILAAIDAGASLATHLGNAAFDMIQRHHNTIFDQLGDDRLYASLIVDGHHLPPHVVRIFTRAKGLDRVILVSDAVQYAGLPAGVYDGGYRQFEVREDGFIGVVGEPRLAGSGLLLVRAIENFTRFIADEPRRVPYLDQVTRIPRRWLAGGEVPVDDGARVFLYWDPQQCRLTIDRVLRAGRVIYQRAE